MRFDVGDVGDVPAAVHAAGYRIVQEALTNVLRHARASHVRVVVARDGDAVRVEVDDDGVGQRRRRRLGQRAARDARARRGARAARSSPARRGRRLAACAREAAGVITVELADDQALVRAGFRALLDAEDDIAVVAEAADGEEAVELARQHRPDVCSWTSACRAPTGCARRRA